MLAPWIAMAIILGGWALAARYLAPSAAPFASPPAVPVVISSPPPQLPSPSRSAARAPIPAAPLPALDPEEAPDIVALRERNLLIPVLGVDRSALVPSFSDARGGGGRTHEALDILAPRGTPVVAVEPGTIVRLFRSKPGGTTIYQFGANGAYCYYYAHLDRYAEGLTEGQTVERGQIIGYVGTTGNAPPNTPHLHFAITRLGPEKHWWEGEAIDPYLVLR
jgi:murein DD-endopeptidase MepM/ murein hydrolase activator NlpD